MVKFQKVNSVNRLEGKILQILGNCFEVGNRL